VNSKLSENSGQEQLTILRCNIWAQILTSECVGQQLPSGVSVVISLNIYAQK
jgi:hypothetical protein